MAGTSDTGLSTDIIEDFKNRANCFRFLVNPFKFSYVSTSYISEYFRGSLLSAGRTGMNDVSQTKSGICVAA